MWLVFLIILSPADTLPRLANPPAAAYPAALAGSGTSGRVEVLVEVDEGGRVVDAAVSTPIEPALDEAALSSARTLRFSPALHAGRPTGFSAIVAYAFAGSTARPELLSVFFPETVSVVEEARVAEPVAVAVTAETARRVPGTAGDPARVIEALPGVARPALGSSDVVLWGAAPAESRVLVDGIEVPALFHLGGLRAVIPAPLVREVEVVPGAYGAALGRGLGGLVRLESAELPAGLHGSAALDPLDATAHLSAGSGRWRIAGAWREGLVHRLLGSASGDAARLVAIPEMRDQQLKATALVSDLEEVQALFLRSSDAVTRGVPITPTFDPRADLRRQSFWRAGLRYRRLAGGGRSAEATVWLGGDRARRELRFGDTPATLDATTLSLGARLWRREELALLALTVGLDALVAPARLDRAGSLTVPPREGDPAVFGQPPGADFNADSWRVRSIDVAPFISADGRRGPLAVTAGARLEALGLDVSRVTPRAGDTPAVGAARLGWAIDPRLSARLALGRLALLAAAGRYHQLPAAEELSAVFGAPALGPARADHAALGASARLPYLSAELTAFAKRLADLPARDPALTPPLAAVLDGAGRGRAVGVQALVHIAAAPVRGLSGWLAYTASRSERQDPGAPFRLAAFDQTHVLALVAGYERGPWHAGTRLRYGTGTPRTPVVAAYYDLAARRYVPILGAVNSTRLPPFFQLDARIERSWSLARATLDLSLELLNLTARRNAEELAYSFDYSRQAPITGLPFFALAGARVRF